MNKEKTRQLVGVLIDEKQAPRPKLVRTKKMGRPHGQTTA